MKYENFFWLHIKKSAGITTRKLLQPHYKEVDRSKKPISFIQGAQEEYNDILNNYRVVLGDYQFKRALFAKEFLYPNNWNSIFSFAFSREPVDRCLSMFYYLYYKNRSLSQKLLIAYNNLKAKKKLGFSISYDFELFLELIEIAHFNSESNYKPLGLHFSTHTAPMFEDITDKEGNILIKKTYRLEDLNEGIKQVFELCGLEYSCADKTIVKNKNTNRGNFQPNTYHKNRIKKIYEKDFDIYEKSALSLSDTDFKNLRP